MNFGNSQLVMGDKFFSSYGTVFELYIFKALKLVT